MKIILIVLAFAASLHLYLSPKTYAPPCAGIETLSVGGMVMATKCASIAAAQHTVQK